MMLIKFTGKLEQRGNSDYSGDTSNAKAYEKKISKD